MSLRDNWTHDLSIRGKTGPHCTCNCCVTNIRGSNTGRISAKRGLKGDVSWTGPGAQGDYDQSKGGHGASYSSSDTLTLPDQSARKSRSPTTTAEPNSQARAPRSRSRSPGRQRIAAEIGRPLSPTERWVFWTWIEQSLNRVYCWQWKKN